MMDIRRWLDQLSSDRHKQFWVLNVFGWAGYSFFSVLAALVWQKNLFQQLVFALAATLSGFLVTLVMRKLIHRIWTMGAVRRGLVTLGIVGLGSSVWALFKLVYYFELMGYLGATTQDEKLIEMARKSWDFKEFLLWYTYSFFILLSWTALYYGIRFYQAWQEEKRRLNAMTLMAHEAQLKMLRYQLNPHFLFNTLNAISTLVLDRQNTTANAMIESLARFLRHTLESDPMQKVPLEEELAALRLYLAIEKVRFDQRLTIDFEVTDEARQALVPSLLLQPLVENSIKYAIAPRETGGKIAMQAWLAEGQLHIVLADDGPGLPPALTDFKASPGVGIRNFRQRLAEIYGNRHQCTFSSVPDQGLSVRVVMPAEFQGERDR